MCAHQRDFTVLLQRDCIRVHARASVSRMRMCWRGKEEGRSTRTGWDGSLRGTMHRPRLLLFCKMSCRITPDNDIANWSVCRFSLDSFCFFLSTSSVDRITPIMVTFDTVKKGRNFEITLHIYHTLNDPWIFELEKRVLLVGITFSKNKHAKYGIEMTRSESHLQTVQHRHRGCHFVKSSKRCDDTTTCTRWIQKLVFDELFLKWIPTKRSIIPYYTRFNLASRYDQKIFETIEKTRSIKTRYTKDTRHLFSLSNHTHMEEWPTTPHSERPNISRCKNRLNRIKKESSQYSRLKKHVHRSLIS